MSRPKKPRGEKCFVAALGGYIQPSTARWLARDVRAYFDDPPVSWEDAKKRGWRVIRATIVPDPLVTEARDE